MIEPLSIYIGYDPREDIAFRVFRKSIVANTQACCHIVPLKLGKLERQGLYRRPHFKEGQQAWDVISDAPMSTEFSISRFLVPIIHQTGWALFADCDMLCRDDISKLFALRNDDYAVMCVKHDYKPLETVKMDGQAQVLYAKKNWSSVMLFNCDHPSNRKLTLDGLNAYPGRELHGFFWLGHGEVGSLPIYWNWLEGHSPKNVDPKIVHFTRGIPGMEGYENVDYADEWRRYT